MSLSGRSVGSRVSSVITAGPKEENQPNLDSPPVSRNEVLEVFETWRNSASIAGRSDDSGFGQVSSSGTSDNHQSSPTKTKVVRKRNPQANKSSDSTTSVSMNNQGNNKLPKIGNKKTSRQSTMHSLISPPGHSVEERRRFVTVVRPLSVFPEPALPPNYTPSVFSTCTSNNDGAYSNRYDDFSPMIQQHNPVQRGRPPSPAPFHRQRPNQRNISNSNFSLAGQGVASNGYHVGGGSSSLKVNLAGGSGWDLTAIKRGYDNVGYNVTYKSMHDRSMENGVRYQSQNALDQENLPLTDDWRRHIDARRKALQRRRTKRRGVADGGSNFGANGDRYYNGSVQTDGNFEELLRRAGDVESSVQTDSSIENVKRNRTVNGSTDAISSLNSNTQDGSTQVVLTDLPDFETSLAPVVEQMVNVTLEQAFVEMLEEEEIKEIRQQRVQFQQLRMAELTTSKLMNVVAE
ncbi:hypothetical protein GHT06_013861 [Daphnia sinensis]|uniref:Uncharacterized protein n=1 Tax=Daphnia sinensis TaxID=1820382 RepID=A0AAD5KUL5_9CRUS|nr:hypothetical protein GHT06_013861 [Daphnia sinensis]